MNRGSDDYQPPTVPYRRPDGRTEPPTGPPAPPAPPRRRRPWLAPVVAVAVALTLAGGTGTYLVYGRAAAPTPLPAQQGRPAAAPPPDTCAMLPKAEAERLVPAAQVVKDSRDAEYGIVWSCDWKNDRVSFGEFWRSRSIEVQLTQHKGKGPKTGRTMAQGSHEGEFTSATYRADVKPTPKPGEKQYYSPVKELPGVGDGAFAQYTWSRSGEMLWYSFGEGRARVGDTTIKVKYQASQQRKDARILTSDSTQSISEVNALREVSGLLTQLVKGVAAWQAKNPGLLGRPDAKASTAPSAEPTPSPTPLAALPPACQSIGPVATGLVPDPKTKATGSDANGVRAAECRWLNLTVPSEPGKVKIRSVLVNVSWFTNRAGGQDPSAAKGKFTELRGGRSATEGSAFGGIAWSEIDAVDGLGEEAFIQYVRNETKTVHAGTGTVVARSGPAVVIVDFSGAELPEGAPINSPRAVLIGDKEARDGALAVARALMEAVKGGEPQITGS